MDVILIDDGINNEMYDIGDLFCDVEIASDLSIHENENILSERTHGTLCAAIIRKYAPNSVFGSIKVLDTYSKKGKAEQLIAALGLCEKMKTRVIHLSIGTEDILYYEPIRKQISRLLNAGKIIIAAMSNSFVFTMPACFSGVIGVKTCFDYKDDKYIVEEPTFMDVCVIASSVHTLSDNFKTSACNSFAAPLITANVVNFLLKNEKMTVNQLKRALSRKSNSIISNDFFINGMPDFFYSSFKEDYDLKLADGHCHNEIHIDKNRCINRGNCSICFQDNKNDNICEYISNGIFFWEKRKYVEMLEYSIDINKKFYSNEYEYPTISVIGEEKKAIDISKKIKDKLVASGFHCGIITRELYILEAELIYAPESICINLFLKYIFFKHIFDIVVLVNPNVHLFKNNIRITLESGINDVRYSGSNLYVSDLYYDRYVSFIADLIQGS